MTDQSSPDPPDSPPVILRTFGAAGLYASGGSQLILGPGKPLALVIYLALTPGRRISREFLMELLWAHLEPDRARNAFRQMLFHLRRVLGENALSGTEELALACAIDIDRDRFLAAAESGKLEAAVDAYTGPFLPEFAAPGGANFERWADLERDRLQTTFIRIAELLVRRWLNESRFRDAQRLARRVRDEVPDSEPAWRLLLESVVAGRDFVAAAVEAQALENHAAAEGVTLERATTLAIARARQVAPGANDTEAEAALVAELTGREREFSIITVAWDAVRAGRERHIHLTAPAGLGKTRLLRDGAARLRAGGARVVELRGLPGDRDIPYAFAGELALALVALPGAAGIAPASASALIGLNPALSSRLSGAPDNSIGDEAHRRRIQSLSDLIQSAAYEQPFALVIDDLHWLDLESYRMLEAIFARLAGAHILCLTAARPERVPAGEQVSIVSLAPLTLANVGSFVTALGALPDQAPWGQRFVHGLHEATRGSPLLILESLRLAIDEEILELDAAGWHCPNPARLESLLVAAEALRRRVRALPDEEQWVLALLATAGMPLDSELLAAQLGITSPDFARTLASLERSGLVMRTEAGWIPAHDEIAEAGRDAIDPARRKVAEITVGKLLVNSAGDDPQRLLRGIRHFVAAGDNERIRVHFRRYAQLSRARRDVRSFRALAAEILADDPASPRVRALVRALPPHWRAGLWSRTRVGLAVAAVLIFSVGTLAISRARDARDALLQTLMYADSSRIAAYPAEWDGRVSPVAPVRGAMTYDADMLGFDLPPVISPDGRSVAWTKDMGDSTTLDIWIRTPAGTRRLTRQIRDDVVYSWVPDGSAVVGMTNRWTSPSAGNYDIAVFDTATGAARQITSGPDHDGGPFVSPDGTRIVFLRETAKRGTLLCVITFDALGEPECRLIGGNSVVGLLGWSSLTAMVVAVTNKATRPLVLYDWERNESVTLLGPYVTSWAMSPDRRWVVSAAETDGIRGLRDWIVPVDHPSNARRVDRIAPGPSPMRWWQGSTDRSLLIDRIEFTDTSRTLLRGVGTRLGVRALSAAGVEIPVHAPVRWSSSDTLVASVDSTGDVQAHKAGTVTVTASLAGWRAVSAHFAVRGAAPVTVLDERWTDDWHVRWILFGDPLPTLATGPEGIRGMWNNGDGTFPSMVVLRRSLSARDGLGVEVRLSTPITRDNWQRAHTAFFPGIDTLALQRGDPKKAPASPGDVSAGCGANFPVASGTHAHSVLSAQTNVSEAIEMGAAAAQLASGKWWTLRVQILPDGRCGIAVNNKVVWLSAGAISLAREFRLRLGDESYGATLLHGPLQIWTGVRTDINWVATRSP
jgi:DNA-binding SARP family transcriptional activator